MKKLLAIIAGAFFIYNIIPTFLMQKFSKNVIKTTKESGVLLTFDDGPNPAYTGKLLDLLKKHQIKAIFFVVASKAAQHPQLIKRMQAEGHVIGIHHHTHKSNFLLSPLQLVNQLQKSQEILQSIVGERVLLYRPPYGHFNIATAWVARDYRMMTWSGMFGDWRSKAAQTTLLPDLINHAQDGKIYVLHDCGVNFGANDDAPFYMLQALKEFLDEAQHLAITFTDAKQYAEKLK